MIMGLRSDSKTSEWRLPYDGEEELVDLHVLNVRLRRRAIADHVFGARRIPLPVGTLGTPRREGRHGALLRQGRGPKRGLFSESFAKLHCPGFRYRC